MGDAWYYAATLSSEDAIALQQRETELLRSGDSLYLRFSKGVDRDLPVTLESVGASENGRVAVVFKGTTYLAELTLLRQQRVQIITGATNGIRVPRESLRAEKASLDENGQLVTEAVTGVYCMVGREAHFKPVNVVYSGDSFALVTPASDTEKLRLRPGEQLVVSARGLYDGKVLQ